MQVTCRVHLLSTRIISLLNTSKKKENSEMGILFCQQYIGTYAIDIWENISSVHCIVDLPEKKQVTRWGLVYFLMKLLWNDM